MQLTPSAHPRTTSLREVIRELSPRESKEGQATQSRQLFETLLRKASDVADLRFDTDKKKPIAATVSEGLDIKPGFIRQKARELLGSEKGVGKELSDEEMTYLAIDVRKQVRLAHAQSA